jgi:predicted nuclease of predicted toxin-antitoxin system
VRFKVDENLPQEIAELFHTAGFDADTVVNEGLKGAGDDVIAKAIQSERRALVTLDTDFGNIRAYPPEDYWGVIVLRPAYQDQRTARGRLTRLVPVLRERTPEHELWIVEHDRIRFRRREN